MMNQATPHLGAESSLINNKSSNRRRQPEMGTALTTEWMASTWMSQGIKRTKKALECKQRHPMTMDHQKGGTYISHQVRRHACHLTSKHCTFLWFVTERSSMKSSKFVDKERIIELMMTKNQFRSWNEKRMRWTLPVGESKRNEDINPVIKESSSQPTTRRCQVSQPCPVRTAPTKSFCQVSHILSIWVGHPLQWDQHFFFLGRSPMTMRPFFMFLSG